MLQGYAQSSLFAIVLSFAALVTASPSAAQDLADIIEKCERSVVRIEVQGKNGDSLGSGFIVEGDGVICTNVHVLAGAQKATATFANGKSYKIEGTYHVDESRDICIAQLAGEDFPKVVVSRVPPRKGETVTALGAPRGLSFTATTGIVSALRSGEQIGGNRAGTWIQIDAALSPGNSGGPLINTKGRVIAMSTLASTGSSQNLNFGISAKDIREAIRDSRNARLTSLPDGVGELELDEGGGAGAGESIINRPTIPEIAMADYIADCRDDYAKLTKKVNRDHLDMAKVLRLTKRANVPLPPGAPANGDKAIMVNTRSKKETYFFRSDRVKDAAIRSAEKQAEKLKEIKSALSKKENDDSMFALLQHTGQFLDPSDKGSFGVLEDAIMIHPFNDHDAIVRLDRQPYLLWMPSTSGMSQDSNIPQMTVYVAGTQTIAVPGDSTMAVTLLIGVKDSELKKAIFKDGKGGSNHEMRTWTAGKFTVSAKVVRVEKDSVVLKTSKGKTIEVARKKLSDSDNKYLDGLQ